MSVALICPMMVAVDLLFVGVVGAGVLGGATRLLSDQLDPKGVCKPLFGRMIHVSGDSACDDRTPVTANILTSRTINRFGRVRMSGRDRSLARIADFVGMVGGIARAARS